ncbi:hypothetical protein AVEN_142105-1, partial [Araneus ventricosus]
RPMSTQYLSVYMWAGMSADSAVVEKRSHFDVAWISEGRFLDYVVPSSFCDDLEL